MHLIKKTLYSPKQYVNHLQSHPKMETTTPVTPNSSKARRPQSAGVPRSPRLSRSSSGASIASLTEPSRGSSPYRSTSRASTSSLPEIRAVASTSPQQSLNRSSRSTTTSPRPSVHRSRSTIKTRSVTKSNSNGELHLIYYKVSHWLVTILSNLFV